MGLVGFLDFVLKCIQLLAWPSFALGYPLCASIRAIETNSDFYMRKLVAYWISFSLISLFEYAFSILLEWVPVWPYVKILTICWLVIPGFNGAIIAYDNIVHPCLSMQLPQIIVDMLNKKQNVSLTRESFLEDAEKYVKENGTEALEKLFSSKPIIDEPPVAQKDIKAVEILDKRVEAAENKDSSGPAMLSGYSRRQKARIEKQQITTVDTDIKVNDTTLTEKFTENAFLAPPAIKNVQKEWTCAVCQVTTQSEATLNSHLQGMKHRTKCEELKAGKQTAIKKGVSTGTPNKERNCAISQVTTQSKTTWTSLNQEFIEGKQTAIKNHSASTTVKSEQANHDLKNVSSGSGIKKVKLQSEATLKSHLQGTKHKSKYEQLKATKAEKDKITSFTKYSDKNSSGLKKNLNTIAQVNIEANVSNGSHWCSICNVTCTSESDMASHLRGNRHLSMIKDSGHTRGVHYWCNICDVKCLSEIDIASHLNGKTHDSNLYESESESD
ncbi:C2H2-type domain-containing protein [Heracleum sosnowskyi]|uniref:C2H2-type domain-containing protein n=1 Tax=Heracleum sosnowskyi TaxID=360622 RepID=A0AAD8MUW5_9APIA|nr:C2H2-type domain-containing protein [Heracleum sosnowskyi]